MSDLPSLDDILAAGRTRERRNEIVLGLVLVVGGLAMTLGLRSLTHGAVTITCYAAIAIGVTCIGDALFRKT